MPRADPTADACAGRSHPPPGSRSRAAVCYFVVGSAGPGVGAVAGAEVGAGDGPAAHGPNVARSLSSLSCWTGSCIAPASRRREDLVGAETSTCGESHLDLFRL